MTNTDPDTGIRYGIIAANSLDPEIVERIQSTGRDVHYDETVAEVEAGIRRVCDDLMDRYSIQDVVDLAIDRLAFEDDEPVHEFEIEGVIGRTTWLGGALLVWVFKSPHTDVFRLCSPCVPGACDLDSPVDVLREKVGEIGYDVPADWRYQE